jgi:hypothetical protein
MYRMRQDRSEMAHHFFSAPHLKHIDSGIYAQHRRVDIVVEGSNWWALVDEVELDSVTIKNLGIETQEVQRVVAITFRASVSDGPDTS